MRKKLLCIEDNSEKLVKSFTFLNKRWPNK